jgi:hypothetical protein
VKEVIMNFSTLSNIEIKKEIVFRTNKDGTVVVMKMDDDDMFYKISGVAAEMWTSFSEKKSNLGQVVNEIAQNYSISEEKVISDSQVFLNKILELNLIEVL